MEECLGVNGRQLFSRVDRNLEECEHALFVQCFIIKYLFFFFFMADHVFCAMDS